MPRKRDIEAAIAAYNSTYQTTVLLPPEAARLLAVMFRRSSVWQGSLGDLAAHGFDARTARLLLRALIAAGFLSLDTAGRALDGTYHLHLPPQRRS